jgi:LPS export ABC transporter protein LptC
MRRSQAQRLARWSAAAAAAIALLVAGVYFYRSAEIERARRAAPPPVPAAVEQRAAEFSFSRVEGGQTVFTVRASRTTEFAGSTRALLEDVWVTIHGRRGDRHDTLHARECSYLPEENRAVCEGRVEIRLASRPPEEDEAGRAIEVETENVSLDTEEGVASTDAPVEFRMPGGRGRAVGVRYAAREAQVRLLREVELHYTAEGAAPVALTGGTLAVDRDRREVRLSGGIRAARESLSLSAQALTLELDDKMRARRLVASGEPTVETTDAGAAIRLAARRMIAEVDRGGSVRSFRAEGGARASRRARGEEEFLEANEFVLELTPHAGPTRFVARGGALASVRGANQSQSLRTEAAEVMFAARGPARIAAARTLAPASFASEEAGRSLRASAQRLEAAFDAAGRLARISGRDGVELEQRAATGATQRATAQAMALRFGGRGQWETLELSGAVRFREGELAAEAARAAVERASGLITLTGEAAVSDSAARTVADSLAFDPRGGRVEARGRVRSSFFSAGGDAVASLAAQPAHVSAERLSAQRDTGRALYSGSVRLWQGDAVIEGAELEFDRAAQTIEARDDVRVLMPPAPGREQVEGLWRIFAARLRYSGPNQTLHLEGGVRAESRAGRITAREAVIELAPGNGAQRVARALATGSVVVEQDSRRATAERGEYLAAEGSFTMTGGVPTITDASRGTATGRKLTFYVAGDKILIDSEEGMRTLTRHRVEK